MQNDLASLGRKGAVVTGVVTDRAVQQPADEVAKKPTSAHCRAIAIGGGANGLEQIRRRLGGQPLPPYV